MTLLQDLRYGARQLRANPGFTAVAALSLALGIGANSAIFQLIDAVRLRTLPVANPQELVTIDFAPKASRAGRFSTRSARLTSGQYDEIRRNDQPFSGFAVWSAERFNLTPGGEARYAEGIYVNGDFFRTLGVPALIGRTLTAEDDQAGCASPAAVVSYGFWQRELAGDPGALGRKVSLDGAQFPILGVTPPEFFGVEVGHRYDVAIPLCADMQKRAPGPMDYWLSVMGRLKPGWTAGRADTYLQTISPALMQATLPPTYRPDLAKRYLQNKLKAETAGNGVSGLRRQYETPLWLLLGATGLVLLIACANVANLLLARASVRERELAIRQAIGASRGRLVTQLLSESVLLAALGTALGLALAQLFGRTLIAYLSTDGNEVFLGLSFDWRVIGFTAAVSTAACLIFGLLPAFRATRVQPVAAMRAGGRGLTSGRERFALRRGLVTAQVALSLVLLVGALLFAGSLRKLLAIDPGFRPEGLVSVSMDLRGGHFAIAQLLEIQRQILDRIRTSPGVVAAAQTDIVPISGNQWNRAVQVNPADTPKVSSFNRVSAGYMKTSGTALIAGRDFNDGDRLGAPLVAIVNEEFARTMFGGNPLGKTFRIHSQSARPDQVFEIVGLARNSKYEDLREAFVPIAYVASTQEDAPGPGVNYLVRVAGPVRPALDAVKGAAARVNPAIVLEFSIVSRTLRESLQRDELMATLAGAFGVLAALLATVGLYGVIAYMVARRQNEIGIRVALGASRGSVLRMVMREAVVLVVAGLAIGAGLALWATRAAAGLLFGVKPNDPATLGAAVALLAAVALVASYAPALRASRVEPMQALRED